MCAEQYFIVQELIASYRMGKLQLMPGCDEDQSLELEILGVLNQIRTTASEVMPAALLLLWARGIARHCR